MLQICLIPERNAKLGDNHSLYQALTTLLIFRLQEPLPNICRNLFQPSEDTPHGAASIAAGAMAVSSVKGYGEANSFYLVLRLRNPSRLEGEAFFNKNAHTKEGRLTGGSQLAL